MKIKKIDSHPEYVQFFCPGCQEFHTVHITEKNGSGAIWTFNGDLNKPTFRPSINLKTGTYADPSWQEPEGVPRNEKRWSVICHSTISNGFIFYYNDTTHELAGKLIELPDL